MGRATCNSAVTCNSQELGGKERILTQEELDRLKAEVKLCNVAMEEINREVALARESLAVQKGKELLLDTVIYVCLCVFSYVYTSNTLLGSSSE